MILASGLGLMRWLGLHNHWRSRNTPPKGGISFPGFMLQEMSNSSLLQAGQTEFWEKTDPCPSP